MTGKALAGIAAAIGGMLLACAGALGAFIAGGTPGDDGTVTAGCLLPGTSTTAAAIPAPPASHQPIGQWTSSQVGNAATIVTVGAALGVPVRGWVVAVATAMQESGLTNLGNLGTRNDHDSLGLFQQRPSQGWGTPAQIRDPVHAATAFYTHLLTVPGWQTMPLTAAAQAVQRSAFPDAYAKWEPAATGLVAALTTAAPGDCTNATAASSGSPAPSTPTQSSARTRISPPPTRGIRHAEPMSRVR